MNSLILELMNDTVLITNDHREFTFISPNIHYIFGYSTHEVTMMSKIEHLLGKEIIPFHNQVTQNHVVNNLEIQIHDKSKIPHSLLINIKQVNINEGTVLYTCRDISDLRQVERKLKHSMQEALCQRNARFTSNEKTAALITADISDPLHAIKLLTDTLLYWETKEKTKEMKKNKEQVLQKISELVSKTQNIILNIQDQLKKTDTFYKDTININAYLKEFLKLYEKDIKNSNLLVELKLKSPLHKCLISSAHLYEVLWIFFNWYLCV